MTDDRKIEPPREVSSLLSDDLYAELRRIAQSYMQRAYKPGVSLQPTALVHEAYLKLAGIDPDRIQDEAHFRALVAGAMRRILIDHHRRDHALKRGGNAQRLTLQDHHALAGTPSEIDLLELDEAMVKLARIDARAAHVAEMRLFGGASDTAIAAMLGVSDRTARNDWVTARAWLRCELSGDPPPDAGTEGER